jgi:hypothetical protein
MQIIRHASNELRKQVDLRPNAAVIARNVRHFRIALMELFLAAMLA